MGAVERAVSNVPGPDRGGPDAACAQGSSEAEGGRRGQALASDRSHSEAFAQNQSPGPCRARKATLNRDQILVTSAELNPNELARTATDLELASPGKLASVLDAPSASEPDQTLMQTIAYNVPRRIESLTAFHEWSENVDDDVFE